MAVDTVEPVAAGDGGAGEGAGGQLAPAVVLVRPREEGNVGATARAMANMGLSELVLVEPAAATGAVAQAFAVGARSILATCRRVASLDEALAPFRRVVATTSARDRRPGVELVVAADLPARLAKDPPGTATALVFGPEVGGLTNEDLARASILVSVPCAPAQPTLNLSQAVLLLAYELYQARLTSPGRPGPARSPVPPNIAGAGAAGHVAVAEAAASTEAERPGQLGSEGPETPRDGRWEQSEPGPGATAGEIEGLFLQLAPLLRDIGFDRDSSFAGVLRDLRLLAARSMPSSREITILRGICRRAGHALRGRADRQGTIDD